MKIILLSGKAESGKDLTAKEMKKSIERQGKKVLVCHFADLVKYTCKTFFDWDGKKDNAGRSLLQYVGTNVIRSKYPNFWVDYISKILTAFNCAWDFVIIPDWRFENEYTGLLNEEVEVMTVRVNRPNYENSLTEDQKLHESETALDNFKFDYTLTNLGDYRYINNISIFVRYFINES